MSCHKRIRTVNRSLPPETHTWRRCVARWGHCYLPDWRRCLCFLTDTAHTQHLPRDIHNVEVGKVYTLLHRNLHVHNVEVGQVYTLLQRDIHNVEVGKVYTLLQRDIHDVQVGQIYTLSYMYLLLINTCQCITSRWQKRITRPNSTPRVAFDLVISPCQLDVIWHFRKSYCNNNIFIHMKCIHYDVYVYSCTRIKALDALSICLYCKNDYHKHAWMYIHKHTCCTV